ncbi:MAG: SDR family NAD(P)-dependent oxidoreductase [Rhodobacterales bacterium]|nr:SDR family NAD(P)-dependent oxidoreductase [Rhodobacterales bacterium]
MPESNHQSFRERYGPTAIVAGASEGLGRSWAEAIAARGVNLILIARRADKLEATAEAIRGRHGVTVEAVSMDLGQPNLPAELGALLRAHDIGLGVYNACYSRIGPFLDVSQEDKLAMVDVNVRGPLLFAHVLAPHLVKRGQGGLVLMSSMSGFQGTAMVGTYAATKAFNTVLGETLWEELGRHGVDAMVCAAGATTTPNFLDETPEHRRAMARPLSSDEVVAEAIERLGHTPTVIPGFTNRLAQFVFGRLATRTAAIRFLSRTTRKMYS